MAECFLGSDYDREKFERLVQEQRRLHVEIDKIADTKPHRRSVKRAEQINAAIQATMAKCMSILGKRDFQRLFGRNSSPLVRLVDPEVMARATDDRKTGRVSARRDSGTLAIVKRSRVGKGRLTGPARIKLAAKKAATNSTSTKRVYGKIVAAKNVVRRKAARKKR